AVCCAPRLPAGGRSACATRRRAPVREPSSRQTWSLLRVRSERPSQTVREHLGHPDAREVADGHASLPVEVDDTVAAGAARELAGVLPRRAVDAHVERLAEEPVTP